jgi:crotonobetainyl-CoA:carnitine CoA-transferase CaiB-like acyl-CoA transferase
VTLLNAEPALKGIRVLDYGRFISAPWCSAILADLGADVLRVEKREGGEDRWVQALAKSGEGGTFLQCNRNKRSLALDTTTPEGVEITRKLVMRSDVVIANMPPKAMSSSGLDYASLKAVKPDIILGSVTAYGEGGPYSDRIGFDGIGQMMSGAISRQGLPDQPIRSVVPYVDFATALSLAIGVMTALYHRKNTGRGQHVESALLPCALMMTNPMLMERDLLQIDRPRIGNRGHASGPCDLFRVKDGWILVQVAGQPMFKRWCRLMGRAELFDDPRFASDDLRGLNGNMLNEIMQDWCNDRTKAEALDVLAPARVPASALYSPQDVLDDPHIQAMGYLKPIPFPGTPKPAPLAEAPFRMSATPAYIRTRAPLLGEHTEDVLQELGYGPARIADLRTRSVI